ncbi:MAG: IclR family transcriptional regulator [Paracoccaceae bacterium]
MTQTETVKTPEYSVPPVERALRLLRYIGDGHACRNLSAAAEAIDINRTTLIRLIHTLLAHRMIEEIPHGGGYRLGVGLISLGSQAMHGRDIVQACQPVLADLCAEVGMSAHMGILDGPDIVYLSRETPNTHLVSNVRAGSRLPAHASSIGRAILAAMTPEAIVAALGEAPLTARTTKTPATIDGVLAQAREDRAMGVAWSEGNFEAGIGSCAAAIFDHTGAPVGALNVSGAQSAFVDEIAEGSTRIRDAVKRAAQRASMALGYAPRG